MCAQEPHRALLRCIRSVFPFLGILPQPYALGQGPCPLLQRLSQRPRDSPEWLRGRQLPCMKMGRGREGRSLGPEIIGLQTSQVVV